MHNCSVYSNPPWVPPLLNCSVCAIHRLNPAMGHKGFGALLEWKLSVWDFFISFPRWAKRPTHSRYLEPGLEPRIWSQTLPIFIVVTVLQLFIPCWSSPNVSCHSLPSCSLIAICSVMIFPFCCCFVVLFSHACSFKAISSMDFHIHRYAQ